MAPETIAAGAVPWLTPPLLERMRVDWNMTVQPLPEQGAVFVSFGGLWCTTRADDFHIGVAYAIEKLLELRHRMGATAPAA